MSPLGASEIGALYRAHGHLVLRRARALLGNEADAQEALQEVFAGVVRAPHELEAAQSQIGWLYQATTHLCLNLLRDRRTGVRLLERHVAPAREDAGEAARAEHLVEVRGLLARLPGEEAAALVYHHLDGMTYPEVAAMLGCSTRKVGYLLERAQEALAREEKTA